MSNPSVKGVSHSPLTVECGGLELNVAPSVIPDGRTSIPALGSSAKSGSAAEKQGVPSSTESADPPLVTGASVGEFVVVGRFGSVILGRGCRVSTWALRCMKGGHLVIRSLRSIRVSQRRGVLCCGECRRFFVGQRLGEFTVVSAVRDLIELQCDEGHNESRTVDSLYKSRNNARCKSCGAFANQYTVRHG